MDTQECDNFSEYCCNIMEEAKRIIKYQRDAFNRLQIKYDTVYKELQLNSKIMEDLRNERDELAIEVVHLHKLCKSEALALKGFNKLEIEKILSENDFFKREIDLAETKLLQQSDVITRLNLKIQEMEAQIIDLKEDVIKAGNNKRELNIINEEDSSENTNFDDSEKSNNMFSADGSKLSFKKPKGIRDKKPK
ncbi:hypothetical protein [Trichoplusia ni ascovirus 2c]|uniref:hypothetical protein n=1 Tax=Trichoplusia ni ascovirus 2c TaxID=328615 RepID=UPI0000E44264|nr:hypothetical protein TNAV2c_gp140 [Trichoplusia ni ascovirus 2c]ABF70657.1 hypothetical protein [Trichoplusia ni ascovirus 2c]AUS94252.1 hypothetical protein [Trichoplusia ni ascovirus 6b]